MEERILQEERIRLDVGKNLLKVGVLTPGVGLPQELVESLSLKTLMQVKQSYQKCKNAVVIDDGWNLMTTQHAS